MRVRLEDEDAGERIDRVLARRLPDVSRATLKRWIDEGRVTIAGRAVRPSTPSVAGWDVEIDPAPPPPSTAEPEDIPLAVVFEDDDVLVIDKPAGLVVHPAAGHWTGTLVNAVLHHAQVEGDDEGTRPGIVHRLDRDTSGVMVVAKSERARASLVAQLGEHTVERAYRAIAVGAPPDDCRIDTSYGRHPRDRKRFSSRVSDGKRAVTHVRTLERFACGAALIEARLETGRTHQVRVHLADCGWPLLGDPMYGRTPSSPRLRSAAEALGRQALHAFVLAFDHPATGRRVRFTTEPPADFQRALAILR
ncbi:MAG: RluA family pseudouridine synthase [Deltaproteobacteria bacterium]|nr:RluA family pseudouridine synthase [Deltaproteobacteria bacterium]